MRYHIIAAICLSPFLAMAQKNINLGQGILNIDFEKQPTIYFYTDTTQITPDKTVSVIRDKEGEFIIKNNSQVSKWFNPEGVWLDYNIFVIRVDTVIGAWYKVIINNEKGTKLWTKIEPIKRFVKWQTFLVKETTAIDKHIDFDLEIKTSPSDNAQTIKMIEKTDCFEAIEIKGDWLKIKTNETLDCNESKQTIKSGWIKWRQNNRLTISYGLTC